MLAAAPAGDHHAAVDCIRSRGRFLQPLRGAGAHRAGAAAAGGGHTRFQPVFAGDVGEAIALAVDGGTKPGAIYEFGGPDVRTFRELMEFILATIGRRRLLVPVPFALMKLQAAFAQFLPKPPITPDQVEMLKRDNVVSAQRGAKGARSKRSVLFPNNRRDRADLSVAFPQDRPIRSARDRHTVGRPDAPTP